MDSLSVDLILAAVVVAVFVIALSGRKIGSLTIGSGGQKMVSRTESRSFKMGSLGKFFDLFWGWADYKPKDWSNAPYKRGYGVGRFPLVEHHG